MGTSALADREAILAALTQLETLTAQMNRLSIDGFSPLELLDIQQRRETVTRATPTTTLTRSSPPTIHEQACKRPAAGGP